MNREDMIRALVEFSLAAAAEDPRASWLRDIFTGGFSGFAGMASADLLRELQYRDLAGFDDSVEDEDFEDDREAFRSESFIAPSHPLSSEDAGRD